MKLINQMRQNAAQKNKAPEHPHDQMKRSTKGIYMFVSQMNKLIEENFPDGDVLVTASLGERGHPPSDQGAGANGF